jgi:hypothetical protein
MKNIILTSNNIVAGSGNSRFRYEFVGGGVRFTEDDEICLSNLSMYYSNFNFQPIYRNQIFTYTWIDATVHTVQIPDANFNITDLNAYFRSVMVANTHYLESTAGQTFYLEFQLNPSRYKVQFNAFPVPTSAQATTAGLTLPSGATWAFPVSAVTPQITVPPLPQKFGNIIGFLPGTYPTSPSAVTYSKLSDIAPQVAPVSAYLITCSLANNDIATNENLIYSFNTGDAPFGSLITPTIPEFSWVQMKSGYFSSFSVEILDQNSGQIQFEDPQINIILGVRKKKEIIQK